LQPSVLARHVPVQPEAGLRERIVATDGDLALELPDLSVERAAEHFEQVHGRQPFVKEPPVP
jgi:hypothetical protein